MLRNRKAEKAQFNNGRSKEELELVIKIQADKLHCRNMQIKDLKAKLNSQDYTWESGQAFKFIEEDVYSKGCLPETAQNFSVDITFTNKSKKGLLAAIKNSFDVKDDALILNSCEEDGRLDISVMEDEGGYQATPQDIASWKKGKRRLWSSIYTYNINKVNKQIVKI